MDYTLEDVTTDWQLWDNQDPVRPELDKGFKTSVGRGVFGLKDSNGVFRAFLCYARTTDVPKSVEELSEMTSVEGRTLIPYTVWSRERGAGRTIINQVLRFVRKSGIADRVVTLSPPTDMARKFHLRNDAKELRVNERTVNFEYKIGDENEAQAG